MGDILKSPLTDRAELQLNGIEGGDIIYTVLPTVAADGLPGRDRKLSIQNLERYLLGFSSNRTLPEIKYGDEMYIIGDDSPNKTKTKITMDSVTRFMTGEYDGAYVFDNDDNITISKKPATVGAIGERVLTSINSLKEEIRETVRHWKTVTVGFDSVNQVLKNNLHFDENGSITAIGADTGSAALTFSKANGTKVNKFQVGWNSDALANRFSVDENGVIASVGAASGNASFTHSYADGGKFNKLQVGWSASALANRFIIDADGSFTGVGATSGNNSISFSYAGGLKANKFQVGWNADAIANRFTIDENGSITSVGAASGNASFTHSYADGGKFNKLQVGWSASALANYFSVDASGNMVNNGTITSNGGSSYTSFTADYTNGTKVNKFQVGWVSNTLSNNFAIDEYGRIASIGAISGNPSFRHSFAVGTRANKIAIGWANNDLASNFIVGEDGRVSINMATASYWFQVEGDARVKGRLVIDSAYNSSSFQLGDYGGNTTGDFIISDRINSKSAFTIQRVTGYVGINQTNPSYQFEVNGTAYVSSTVNIGANIISKNTTGSYIMPDSVDGSDNRIMALCGGGDYNVNRGGCIGVYGNEHTTYPGYTRIHPGSGNGTITGAIELAGKTFLGTRPTNDFNWNIALSKFFTFHGSNEIGSFLIHNAYHSTNWKYRESTVEAGAAVFNMGGGQFQLFVADDGLKDAIIDWKQALTIAKTGIATFGYNVNAPTFTGALTGNASTATKLATARTINGVSFDGSTNITITANTTNALTAGSYLTGGTFNGSAAVTFAVDATSANTANKVVARDGSGNFSAGTITASLSGNATSADKVNAALSLGTHLSYNSGTTFDGSAARTINIDATDAATNGTIVARSATGGFNASNIGLYNSLVVGYGFTGPLVNPPNINFGTSHSSTKTAANCKIFLYKNGTTYYGFGVGSESDVQYHTWESASGNHTFYVQDVEYFKISSAVINSKTRHIIQHSPADTAYNYSNIELQSDCVTYPARCPSMGFHRGGIDAASLLYKGNGGNAVPIFTVRDHTTTTEYTIFHTGNFDGSSTKLWSITHPSAYYIYNQWTGIHWQIVSNHPSPVRVGYADSAGYAASAGNADTVDGYHIPTAPNWTTMGALDIVVGNLAWKNYGNNHIIFDASAGTAPNGSAINNINAQYPWVALYPTLMGWDGANTFGVRVDSARVADWAGSAGYVGNSLTINGQSFNGSAPVTLTITASGDSNNTPNAIVQRDGNGGFSAGDIVANNVYSRGIEWYQVYTPFGTGIVCYGNGKFVSVPLSTTAITTKISQDGINCTGISIYDGVSWKSVCYGNGLFVAVGSNNKTMMNINNESIWVRYNGTGAGSSTWKSVCYGNGKFVAVGNETNGMYSYDGANWKSGNSMVSATWNSVCYGNGKFVAVGDYGKCAHSSDGITWTNTYATPYNDNSTSVCYGNGLFVAVSSIGNIIRSTDGINWVGNTFSGMSGLKAICYGNGLFVAVGSSRNVAISKDGINWTIIVNNDSVSLNSWDSICYGNGIFVGDTDSGAATLISGKIIDNYNNFYDKNKIIGDMTINGSLYDSGIGWRQNSNAIPSGKISYGNGLFVTSSGYFSSDGINWKTLGAINQEFICYGNGIFVTSSGYFSSDGMNWFSTYSDKQFNALTYGNGLFVGSGYNNIHYSYDGLTWVTEGLGHYIGCACYGNGLFVVLPTFNYQTTFFTSTNGITWTSRTSSAVSSGNYWKLCCYGNGIFVALSESDCITSPDGITWTTHSIYLSIAYIDDLIFAHGLFVISFRRSSSYYVSIATSPDGINWTVQLDTYATLPGGTSNSLGYGNGLFVAGVGYISGKKMTIDINRPNNVQLGGQTIYGLVSMKDSLVVGTPTGGDKGTGTINAVAVYDDNVLLTKYVLDYYLNKGSFSIDNYQREKSVATKFLQYADMSRNLDDYNNYISNNRMLPSFAEIELSGETPSVGLLAQKCWEELEIKTIHIMDIHNREKQLEIEVAQLKSRVEELENQLN